jgi:hypothetical protein
MAKRCCLSPAAARTENQVGVGVLDIRRMVRTEQIPVVHDGLADHQVPIQSSDAGNG